MGFLSVVSNVTAVLLVAAAMAALWTVMAVVIWIVRRELLRRDDATTRKLLLMSALEDSLTAMKVGRGYVSMEMGDNVYWLKLMAIENRANYDHEAPEYRKAAS
jgi:hypothetical protein